MHTEAEVETVDQAEVDLEVEDTEAADSTPSLIHTLAPDLAEWSENDWASVLDHTNVHANIQVRRRLWRGSPDGVLPGGFNPESIAAQAIADSFDFVGRKDVPGAPASGSIAPIHTLPDFQRLMFRVSGIVTRLYQRSENRVVRNEPDLRPVYLDDGERARLIDLIPDLADPPDAALLKKESLSEFLLFRTAFTQFLARSGDHTLIELFHLFCDGLWRPSELASNLNLSVPAVKNLRRRFLRRWHAFSGFAR